MAGEDDLRRRRLSLLQMQARARQQGSAPVDLRPQAGETPEAYRSRVNANAAAAAEQGAARGGFGDELAPEVSSRGIGDILYDNLIGNPDDGVQSYGETLGSWLGRAGESATLGLIGDEASAAAYSMLPGRNYEDELSRFRQNEEDLGMWGRLSADLAGGIAPAALGVGAVGAAASTLPGRMAAGAGIGAGAGAVQGFMEGEGGFGDRASSGIMGSGLGAIIGGAIPGIAEVGRSAVSGAQNAWRGRQIGRQVGEAVGVSPDTGRVAAALIGADDQAAMAEALRRAGPGAMLGDASGRSIGALDAVLQSPVAGADIARRRINERASASGDALMDALRGGVDAQPFPTPIARAKDLNAANRAITNPAYRKAYEQVIDYTTPEGREIEELIMRVPPGKLKQAFDAATDRMVYDGMPPQLQASIGDDGQIVLSELPNVIQLDYLKRAFDDMAEAGKDALTGQMTPDAGFAARIARDIREATKSAVPEYGEALSSGATGIRARAAIRDGAKLLDDAFTVEQAANMIEDATSAERGLIREGLISQIEHRMGNVKAVASDRNVDAREAQRSWQAMTSQNAKQKLRMLFGDEWPAIESRIDEAGAALGLRADVSTNSRTFGRRVADEAIDTAVRPSALEQGRPIEAARNLVGGLTGASPEAIARSKERVRSELAELLTRQGGAPASTIDAVIRALQANPQNFLSGSNTALWSALGLGTAAPAVTGEIGRGMRR